MKPKPPFLVFYEQPSAGRATRIWSVVSTVTRDVLGWVQWHAPWRRYTFRVDCEALILDAACALEIATFLEAQMRGRARERSLESRG